MGVYGSGGGGGVEGFRGPGFSAIWGFRGEVTPAVAHVLLLSGIFAVAVPASVVIILRIVIIANTIMVNYCYSDSSFWLSLLLLLLVFTIVADFYAIGFMFVLFLSLCDSFLSCFLMPECEDVGGEVPFKGTLNPRFPFKRDLKGIHEWVQLVKAMGLLPDGSRVTGRFVWVCGCYGG